MSDSSGLSWQESRERRSPETNAPASLRAILAQAQQSVRQTFAAHMPLYLCAIVFLAATEIIADAYHVPLSLESSIAFLRMIPQVLLLTVVFVALREFIRLLKSGMPGSPAAAIWRALISFVMEGDRPGNIVHAIVTLTPLMVAFSALKDEIPHIQPFAWDHAFMRLDMFLGGGETPWQRLQPILGYAPVTAGLNLVYDFWFLVMFGSLFWTAFAARNSTRRMQFLIAFSFSWFIAGNALATLFSSAGPCFYHGVVHGPDPYAAQMAYLRALSEHWPVWSIQTQDLLWDSYVTGNGLVRGISAMPSMHVTVAVLVACLCWGIGKPWRRASVTFAALIMVGSVHLGWHYAADGIAGGALALVFWWAAGRVITLASAVTPALPAQALSIESSTI